MAFTRLSLAAFSLLLLSLLVIASAADYGNYYSSNNGYNGTPADSPQPKPEEAAKPEYGTKLESYQPKPEVKPTNYETEENNYQPKPEGELNYKPKPEEEAKPSYRTKPVSYKPKPEEEAKPSYRTKPVSYKPKPEEKPANYETEKNNYQPMPDGEEHNYKPMPEEKAKPNYGTKPDSYKPMPEEEKPAKHETKEYNYQPKPEGEEYNYKPKPEEKEMLLSIAVEGTVLCKSGSKYYPIQGALAKITCQAVDAMGLMKTVPICSVPTDVKGYFFATLPSLSDLVDQSLNLNNCKAFLQGSPLKTCNVSVDVNKGISGAPFTRYGILNEKHTKLYSVGPFFYTPAPAAEPVPNNGN